MAVTKGHGNPHWTKDETILALDLYFELNGNVPSKDHKRVIELSDYLRTSSIHAGKEKKSSFRNPDGVVFKLQNLRSVATGVGLSNTSKVDVAVWNEYGTRSDLISKLTKEILEDEKFIGESIKDSEPGDFDDVEYVEGDLKYKAHRHRERSRKIRKDLLKKRSQENSLHCDLCTYDAKNMPENIREAAFEAHHIEPLEGTKKKRKTKLSDMSLMCATCHRLLHRLMKSEGKHFNIVEAKRFLNI